LSPRKARKTHGPAVSDAVETATVVALTHTGEGVVRGGKTIFVAGALPGETVKYRRRRTHRQHDEAELVEVLTPAPERVTPRCPHFGVCGGCALQHLTPEAQLEAKQSELRDNLERLGRVTPRDWLPALRGPVWGYRRRARLGAKFVTKKGKVLVGFRERLAPYIADVRHCDVLAPPVGDLVTPLADLIMTLSIRERLPQIEVAVADNAVALVLRVLEAPSASDLEQLRAFGTRHSVRLYLQPGGLDSVHELAESPGEPLRYGLHKFKVALQFQPTDFIQVNGAVNEALVSRAMELLELTPSDRVLDLFCGIGNFTLPIARSAGNVVGVEGDASLVARARQNARLNQLENVEFHVADLARLDAGAEAARNAPWLREKYTHVVLDPPRAGAQEVLASVASLQPRRVLYISCHPGSLARDLGVLVNEHGFTLEAAGVLDMFPHTAHFESLALLSPKPLKGRAP
jgi:23S rRNA (uracil1939-C5)-methyltransferase